MMHSSGPPQKNKSRLGFAAKSFSLGNFCLWNADRHFLDDLPVSDHPSDHVGKNLSLTGSPK
jgi:hypothetical protein